MIAIRDMLTNYARETDTYVPHTYVALQKRFETSVADFMQTVPETLNEDQKLTIQTYLLSSTWYTWEHYRAFIRSCEANSKLDVDS